MIVQCPSCETKFRIADAKISPAGVKVRCSKCAQVFVVRKSASAEPADPAFSDAAPAEPADPAFSDAAPAPLAGSDNGDLAPSMSSPPSRSTTDLFASLALDPPAPPSARLEGAKDPFAFSPPPLPEAPAEPDWNAVAETPSATEPDPFGAEGPAADLAIDAGLAGEDAFEAGDAPRFSPFTGSFGGEARFPDPDVGGESDDPSVRFPPPPTLAEADPGNDFESEFGNDPDPFIGPGFGDGPDLPAEDAPFAAFEDAAPEPTRDGSEVRAPRVSMGQVAALHVPAASLDIGARPDSGPQERVSVPHLKWPPRVGLLVGTLLAVWLFVPGPWSNPLSPEPFLGSSDVRTVNLHAWPYALDIDDPVWLIRGYAEVGGEPYPMGLDVRVRVRSGQTTVADAQVPVGVIPPVDVIASGVEAVRQHVGAQPRPPLAPASRNQFLVVVSSLGSSTSELKFDVSYIRPSKVDRPDPTP